MPFQARIGGARFGLGRFIADDMQTLGGVLVDGVFTLIRKAFNVDDAPAKALKPGRNGRRGYPDYKASHGLLPVRDWVWTGRTLRSLKVKSADENQAVIGFVNPTADRVAHANNLREKQFGVSPKDRSALNAAVLAVLRQARVIRV